MKRHFVTMANDGAEEDGEARENGTLLKALQDETDQAKKHASTLQWALLGAAIVIVALGLVVRNLANKPPEILLWVVEVSEAGQVRNVGMLPQKHGDLRADVVTYLMRDWLYLIRRVPEDRVTLTEQLQRANALMTNSASTKARDHVTEMFTRLDKGWTTQIEIGPLLPMQEDFRAVQLDWHEKVINRAGMVLENYSWRVIVHLAQWTKEELKTAREMRNPLGLYVTDFSWTPTDVKPGQAPLK